MKPNTLRTSAGKLIEHAWAIRVGPDGRWPVRYVPVDECPRLFETREGAREWKRRRSVSTLSLLTNWHVVRVSVLEL